MSWSGLTHALRLLPTLQSLILCQYLDLGRGENTYTMEIGKCYDSGFFPSGESAVNHLPAPTLCTRAEAWSEI